MNPNIYATAEKWEAPTVSEVDQMMERVAEKLGCTKVSAELSTYFGSDARTFRRWRNNSETRPNDTSTIKYTAWALFVAIADNVLILTEDHQPITPKNDEAWLLVRSYHADVKSWTWPPIEITSLYCGRRKNTISGLTRAQLASLFGYNDIAFGKLMNRMNFTTWSLLLILHGVPVNEIFDIKTAN